MRAGKGPVEGIGSAALRELHRTRRQRYVEQLDVMEVLYRVYVVVIFGALTLGVLAGALHEALATPTAVDWLREQGPAVIGSAIALAVFAGLRTGARGGPLAIEAAEVQYVLLAPVDRGVALRRPALRQMRIAALVGAALGIVLGNFVLHRLPGSPVEWIGCLALFGALLLSCAIGAALIASGRRLSPPVAAVVGFLLIAWSGADVALGSTTSPATMLGELATLPLHSGVDLGLAGLGTALGLVLVALALLGVGGIRLEAARRRAALSAELRFSASVQDLRAVVLLRRQLASEQPRRRPWLRLPASGRRHPVWRRGWQSFLRWPAARVVRAALLGSAAGALAVGAWSATVPALFLPGLLLFVAAIDLVEPLAQESDRPTRRQLLPIGPGLLIRRQLAAPATALAIVILIATATAVLVTGDPTALAVGLVLCAPLALGLTCCAAFSATNDPYAFLLTPEIGYAVTAAPLLAASLLVGGPLLAAHAAEQQGGSAGSAALGLGVVVAVVAAVAVPLLSQRFDQRDAAKA